MKILSFLIVVSGLLTACSFQISPLIDEHYFIESQLMRVHLQIDLETGCYFTTGTPSELAQKGDQVVRTQYRMLQIYEELGYYKPTKVGRMIDQNRGVSEEKNFDEVQKLNLQRTRKSWLEKGDLDEDYPGRLPWRSPSIANKSCDQFLKDRQ